MSLLAMPVAASIAISRSRPESGTGVTVWNSPGVAAPSQAAASTLDRRSVAVAARGSPARLKASAPLDAASAASRIAPRASKSLAALASSLASRAPAAAALRGAGEVVRVSHAGCRGAVAAGGRHPAREGGRRAEVRGDRDLGEGHPLGGADLGAGPGQLLGLGEPARLGQRENLVNDVHGRVGD